MISLYNGGRSELRPETASFNSVIDALVKSQEPAREKRAEALLEQMDELSLEDEMLSECCRPNQQVS